MAKQSNMVVRYRFGGLWIAVALSCLSLAISAAGFVRAWPLGETPTEATAPLPPIVVNVPPQPAPVVNVAAPEVHVMPPEVHVDAPVTVQPSPPPSVTVETAEGYLKGAPPCRWLNRYAISCAAWR